VCPSGKNRLPGYRLLNFLCIIHLYALKPRNNTWLLPPFPFNFKEKVTRTVECQKVGFLYLYVNNIFKVASLKTVI
jgi:hypothetical protein